MKKIIYSTAVLLSLGATSCVKDWKCDCTDGTSTTTVTIYPDTKLFGCQEKM